MPAYTTTTIPTTAILASAGPLARTDAEVDAIVGRVRQAPQGIFMGRSDMAYDPSRGARGSREEQRIFAERMRRWTRKLYDAGVEIILPYVCNQSIKGGTPEDRTGIWGFYDRWEEYGEDLGPRPAADPAEWMQREPDGRMHFNYPFRYGRTGPTSPRYAPCPNNPYWHGFLKVTIRLLAEGGYNGVFVDNNILHCFCKHCEREFKVYLDETYSPDQRRRRFGADDVDGLRLSTKGDKVLWATAQRAYLERIRDNEPELFRRVFGTDDLDAAVPSEAGNGFHWGRSQDFWLSTLKSQFRAEEVGRILREGDVTTLGVETPEERCLWADTQKFWAWSIGRRNAELRAAARTACPDFAIAPNWGDMSGFRHTDSRRLEAKNVRLWKGGTDILFFENEYYPGTLAPGYTLDLIIEYKYSAACGIRSLALPYRGAEHRSVCELGCAEMAAWSGDGVFMGLQSAKVRPCLPSEEVEWERTTDPLEGPWDFPEIRKAYRSFFERHAEWYRDRTSYADVGLVLSFDELHMENAHHLREAYSIAHYLTDNHIPFDFLNEAQLRREELDWFRLVVVPHVQFLPHDAHGAITSYLREGGRILFTGNTAAFDEDSHPFAGDDTLERTRSRVWSLGTDALDGFADGIAWLHDVYRWLPKREFEIHDIADFNVGTLLDDGKLVAILKASKSEQHADPRLADLLNDLAGTELRLLSHDAPSTVRVAVWWRPSDDSLVVHLVNYDVPGAGLPDRPVEPVKTIAVSVPLPSGVRVSCVTTADPWDPEPAPLPFGVGDGRVHFVVPHLSVYRVVRVG